MRQGLWEDTETKQHPSQWRSKPSPMGGGGGERKNCEKKEKGSRRRRSGGGGREERGGRGGEKEEEADEKKGRVGDTVEITNTMHRSAPLLYSTYRLPHVLAAVCHHQGASGSISVT
jgi:hypothetical protein